MTMTPEEATRFAANLDRLVGAVEEVLLGKNRVVRLAFTALLSEGHLLLDDVPGTGKTSLARAMAQSVAGTSNRVQFTPDLLPGDITGVTVYDQRSGVFEFHPGPIFANIVLADEINRASPKTQSALLEVMEEGQVTVDGRTHPVGHPFMVIATQNPVEQAGTYRLPEAQLDRFLMRSSIGYPDHASTIRILEGADQRAHDQRVPPQLDADRDRRHGRPRPHGVRRPDHPRLRLPARRRDPDRARGASRRQRPRSARAHPRRQDPRRRTRTALRRARRRQGARRAGARAPPDPRPRGRVRRRDDLEHDRPGAHRDAAPLQQAGRVSFTQTRTTIPEEARTQGLLAVVIGRVVIGVLAAAGVVARWARAVQGVVTPVGWATIAGSVAALAVGYAWGWAEFIAIGWGLALLVAAASVWLIGRGASTIELTLPTPRVVVGELAEARLVAANPGRRRFGGVQLELPVGGKVLERVLPGLPKGGAFDEQFRIPTDRRGIIPIGPARTVRADPDRA